MKNAIEKRTSNVMWIHSSDLMFPNKWGASANQLIVISRLLDTELWHRESDMRWHIRLADDGIDLEKTNSRYCHFLREIEKNGYHPEMSVFTLAEYPMLAQFDGTHRMGWMLSKMPNFFLPAVVKAKKNWFPMDGKRYMLECLNENEVNILIDKYNDVRKKMRNDIIGLIREDVIEKIGLDKVVNIIADGVNVVGIVDKNVCWKSRKYWQFSITLKYQEMYYKKGKIGSKVVDNISDNLKKASSYNWGYIASTVTESIAIENKIYGDLRANE